MLSTLKRYSVLSMLPLALAFAPAPAAAQCTSCVNAVTVPSVPITYSSVVANTSATTQLASTGAGLFALTLSGVPAGNSLGNQTYAAWCGGWWDSPVLTDGSTGFTVASSYSATFPAGYKPIVAGDTLNMVNYILNNKAGTVQDVQDAIWTIMTGDAGHIISATAQGMVTAAKANPAYYPPAGGVLAVYVIVDPSAPLAPDNSTSSFYYQNLLVEVPVPAVTTQCSSCINQVVLPTGNVSYSGIVANTNAATQAASSGAGYFTATLAGVPTGYSVTNQPYAAWCASWFSSPLLTAAGTSGPIYNTFAANFPANLGPIIPGNTINMVNYILNNKSGTVADVQDAIWVILTGVTHTGTASAATQAMVTAALANPTYCPPTGGVIAMYLAVDTAALPGNANDGSLHYQNILLETVCNGQTSQGTPGLTLKKTANKTTVNPFQKVTYTYVVTNTGTVTLTGVVVVDDNATPDTTKDDFTVGTIASLAPGASVTLTASVYPPVKESSVSSGDNNDHWGTNDGWGDGWSWGGGWGSGYGGSWGYNNTPGAGGTLTCKDDGKGKLQFTYREDKSMTDNTYGRYSSSDWGWYGHRFTDVANLDACEFAVLDSAGNTSLDFVSDYVSSTRTCKSGWKSLGTKGGNGKVLKGDGTKVLRCDTSLSHNLNSSSKNFKCTTDSSTGKDWDTEHSYTITVDTSVCGYRGFGGIKIPEMHNHPAKDQRCNDRGIHPVSSTATNTAVASVTYNGTVVSATAKASVYIDASSRGWSQCSKY